MGLNVGELDALIDLDDRPFAKGLDGLDTKVAATSSKLQREFDKVGSKLADVGASMSLKVTLPVAGAMAFATKAASDLGEAVNVTGLTFGEARGEIDKFVKTSATGLGQSERAAREATTTFGGLLTNLGYTEQAAARASIDLTKLASDLGSAFNREPAEAVQALAAAVRGETEPIRAFNVMLDDAAVRQKAVALGLAETAAAVDANGKAQATLALIMEQTSRVQGDFANTADGLANQTRIAKAELEDTAAELGAHLLPIALNAVGVVRDLVKQFADLDPTTQKAALGAAAVVAGLGPVLSITGNVTKAVGGLTTAYQAMGAAGSVATVGLVIGLASVAKGFLDAERRANELVETTKGQLDTSSLDSMREAVDRLGGEHNELAATYRQQLEELGRLRRAMRETGELINPFGTNPTIDLREAVDELNASHSVLNRQYETARKAILAFAEANKLSRNEVERLAHSQKLDLTGSYEDITGALADAYSKTKTQTGATTALAKASETLGDKLATAEERLEAFNTALDVALGGTVSVTDASIRHQEAIVSLAEALTANGAGMDLTTEKGRAMQSAFNDVIESTKGEVDALVEAGQVAEGSAKQKEELTKRLDDLKKKFPELAQPIDDYITKINAIPDTATTAIIVDDADARRRLDELNARLTSLPKGVFLQPGFDPAALINDVFAGAEVPQRAMGGPAVVGQMYRVHDGEYFKPAVSGSVLTPLQAAQHAASAAASNADSRPVFQVDHLEVPRSRDPDYSAEATTRELRKLAILGR